jgi:transposase InsO family protein
LARYPRPLRIIHDTGGEFMGNALQRMLYINGIKDVSTSACNPQANAVSEQMHKTVGNILRSSLHSNPPYY